MDDNLKKLEEERAQLEKQIKQLDESKLLGNWGVVVILLVVLLFRLPTGMGIYPILFAGLMGSSFIVIMVGVAEYKSQKKLRKQLADIEMKQTIEIRQKEKEKEEERRRQEEKARAQRIYFICNKRGIEDLSSDKNKEILRLIAANEGMPYEMIVGYFEEGLDLTRKEKVEKEKERLRGQVEYENKRFKQEMNRAQVTGKERYIYGLKEAEQSMRELEHMLRDFKWGKENAALENKLSVYRGSRPKGDWAIAGGIAAGLAGPAAGFASAYDVQRRNAQAEAQYEEDRRDFEQRREVMAQRYEKSIAEMKEQVREANYKRMAFHKYSGEVEDRLLDDQDQNSKFEQIELNVERYEISQTGNMEIGIRFRQVNDVKIGEKEAILDGSIQIQILDGDAVVGQAFLAPELVTIDMHIISAIEEFSSRWKNADRQWHVGEDEDEYDGYAEYETKWHSFDEFFNKTFGFKNNRNYDIVIGKSTNGQPFSTDVNYTFRAVPLSMWAIESHNVNI